MGNKGAKKTRVGTIEFFWTKPFDFFVEKTGFGAQNFRRRAHDRKINLSANLRQILHSLIEREPF